MNYLDGLNQPQRQAVLHIKGPLLILAGAGAGKTKTITHRIFHLVHSGIAPSRILAITFTNKAAKEMRERVEDLLGSKNGSNLGVSFQERPFVSTFHSLGVHILKENAHHIGLSRHFSIFDRSDSKKAIKEAMEEAGIDPKRFDPGKILHAISREKGNVETPGSFGEKAGNEYFPKLVANIWQRYENILKREKALDFDDLLLKTAFLLRQDPEILSHYQKTWEYIHIDEYQDTNKVQYTIAKLIAGAHKNICAVGDIDQMIYSWRGATIENILNFEKDYPDAAVIVLEENYRSTQTILTAANKAIAKNKMRREKNLFTKNTGGEPIGVFGAYDESEEGDFIATKARELINRGISAREIAVLYRANFQSRVLEEACLSANLPYQVLGTRFFERKEVKDILCYLKAGLNQESLADIKRVINVPARGIGKLTILKIFSGQKDTLPSATKAKVNTFFDLLKTIGEKARTIKPSETLKYIIKASGMEDQFKKSGSEEDLERLENTKELVTLATRYDSEVPEEGIERLLTDAALASDQDSLVKNENAIKLMTVHASKGLEFDYVFITGLEENLFPHQRSGEEKGVDEEEERRLFYVALTRARKKIFLTYANTRTIFGSRQVNIPSEFLVEMDEELVQAEEHSHRHNRGAIKTIYFD